MFIFKLSQMLELSSLNNEISSIENNVKDIYKLNEGQLKQRYHSSLTAPYHTYKYYDLRRQEIRNLKKQLLTKNEEARKVKREILDIKKKEETDEYASRDVMGMDAEIDGNIFTERYLHRKWYFKKYIDVPKKIKQSKYTLPFSKVRAYQWAEPIEMKGASFMGY